MLYLWEASLSDSAIARRPVDPADLVARHASPDARSAPGSSLLTILHTIQDEAGYIPDSVVAPLARAMNLSRAEVHGVVTYYHDFRTSAPPRVTIRLCRAESCRSMGGEALAAHIETRVGYRFDAQRHRVDVARLKEHATSDEHYPSGDIGLESVYCLGLCGTSPAMMIDDKPYAKVTPVKFDVAFKAACVRAGIALKEVT